VCNSVHGRIEQQSKVTARDISPVEELCVVPDQAAVESQHPYIAPSARRHQVQREKRIVVAVQFLRCEKVPKARRGAWPVWGYSVRNVDGDDCLRGTARPLVTECLVQLRSNGGVKRSSDFRET
jgi:hypothetical protein